MAGECATLCLGIYSTKHNTMKQFDIKKLGKKVTSAFKKVTNDSDNDWRIVLVLMCALSLYFVVADINTFIEVKDISNQKTVSAFVPNSSIDEQVINTVLTAYDKREARYNELLASKEVLIDPGQ